MDGHLDPRQANLNDLRARISVAAYKVDPVAVAGAVVAQRWSLAIRSGVRLSPADVARRRSRARVRRVERLARPRRPDALAA
jgi:hypothetical protein